MYPNQGVANNGVHTGGTQINPAQHQNVNYNGVQQQRGPQQSTKGKGKKPFVKIIEQPAGKALRFRYECEGRSAGSIPGVNSTPENKTYPTIEIVGYKGRAVVVVSCVTKDPPYRPHPHNLVGKEGCKKGVCTIEINSETMRAVFSNLGIQCVKKKDIDAALKAREDIRVDPFKTGFEHRCQPSSIDLNSVRLCFQVFLESEQGGRFTVPLTPVISEPIFDKKAMSDLVICRLCSCSATVLGNTQIILLCEKVAKDDITVRFFEEKDGKNWEAYGDFQQTDVHKQTAITFRTPRYYKLDITEPAKVFVQLKRPSDGVTSEALPFEYIPLDSGRTMFWNLHRNLKRKPDLDLFQQISDIDNEKKQALALEPTEVIDLNTPVAEQQPENNNFVTPSAPPVAAAPMETENVSTIAEDINDEAAKRRSEHEIDIIIDEKVRELEQQAQLKAADPVDQEPSELRQISATDKINEWMKSNEFTQSTVDDYNGTLESSAVQPTPTVPNDEDKTLNDLLDQVAELDEIYADHVLQRESYNTEIMNEMNSMEVNAAVDHGKSHHLANMETEESFDDAATYTSLQIAFKNPIAIPIEDLMPPTPPLSHLAPEDIQIYDPVDILSSPKQIFTPLKQISAPVGSPHMHVTAAEEDKLPPLPPKRLRKQDSNAENQSIEANIGTNTQEQKSRQQPSPIIIMKTPDQSPPTKRLPPKPGSGNTNTLPKQKKPGFFSKLFSRGKSKSDLSREGVQNSNASSKYGSKMTTPNGSREPSIGHFHMNDSFRASMRSAKSLQPGSVQKSPLKESATKTSKPVGRSVSSVSGKRPPRLTADVVHIPLKGDSVSSLPQNEAYSNSSTITLGALDRRTVSALQLADIPINDGNMELVAIADRQSLRNLCEGEFNVQLDPDVDLTEAEHFALYTSIPPQATSSEFDETSAYYAPVDAGEILTPDEIAKRLAAANHPVNLRRKRQKTNDDSRYKIQQEHNQQRPKTNPDHTDGQQKNMTQWNTLMPIKTEPRDTSPQSFGTYRHPSQMTPSPQPHSPSNVYTPNNPALHYNMTSTQMDTCGTGVPTSQVQLSARTRQFHGGGADGTTNENSAAPMSVQNCYSPQHQPQNAIHQQQTKVTNQYTQPLQQQQQQQQQFQQQLYEGTTNWTANENNQNANNHVSNPFNMHMINANAAGASNQVLTNNTSNLNQTNTFFIQNTPNNIAVVPPWNIPPANMQQQQMLQQQQQFMEQQQYQQHLQPTPSTNMSGVQNSLQNATQTTTSGTDGTAGNNDENGPTVSNLLTFDSGQLLPLNSQDQQNIQLDSEDLQISNLSIST